MSRLRRIVLPLIAGLIGLIVLIVAAGLAILPTDWFRGKVRDRIVYETERATGARVEIGSFRFDWKSLSAEVSPFILHGTEPPGQDPLFRAESVQVILKIVSAFKRDVDIQSLIVDQPRFNLLIDAHGKTNFPEPKVKRPSSKNPVERLLALAIGRIELRNGEVHDGDRKTKLDLRGRNLRAVLNYNFSGPRYEGKLSMRQLRVSAFDFLPVDFDFDTDLTLFGNRIRFNTARFAMPRTVIDASGDLVDFKSPRLSFDVTASGAMEELAGPLKLPIQHTGTARFQGKLTYDLSNRLLITGRGAGEGLAIRESWIHASGLSFTSDVRADLDHVALRDVTVHALGGVFRGMADFANYKTYKVNGAVTGIPLASVAQSQDIPSLAYSGAASGPVELTGSFARKVHDLKAGGKLQIQQVPGAIPVNGFVELAYDQASQRLQFGNSNLEMPASRLAFEGTLGEQLKVRLDSRNLKDVLPGLALLSKDAPTELPLDLRQGGSAVFEGTVTGPVQTARIAGALTLTNFEVQDQPVDRLVATVDATAGGVHVASFALGQDTLRLNGAADIALSKWRVLDSSAISATLQLSGARLAKLLTNTGQTVPIDGILSASADVSGTAGSPKAVLRATVDTPTAYGEKFDHATAEVHYTGSGVEVINGVLQAGQARIQVNGAYEHPLNVWKNGRLRFDVQSGNLLLQQITTLQKLGPAGHGRVDLQGKGIIAIRNGELFPETVNGNIRLRDLVVEERPVGSFSIDASTTGQQLKLAVSGNLRGSKVTGGGQFQLAGDYPGTGQVDFSPITLSTLQDLIFAARGRTTMPFDGFLGGRLTFSGPARNMDAMRARLELPTLQVTPSRRTLARAQTQDLALRNQDPIVLEYNNSRVQITSAHLVGKETDLKAAGYVHLNNSKNPWDLQIAGNLNLGVLENFNTDVISSGGATVNATVRGSLNDPQLSGRLELKKASFYLQDLPNGLDDANGVILFDTRRATIEKLTASTGGGTIAMSGFVGFGGTELSYRVQARADGVRVRYPEGVSTTLNAQLSLTGTSAHSMLAGVITVRRAGFNPRTDIGGLLAASAKPVATPVTPNEFLRGMQLDVRVETVPNLQFQTSLTADLQAEADLRLRGTAAKPAVLGRIVVNQGEIQFFGNKYSINRGEIGFYNSVTIEPVLDLDLETRVRGIVVNISVTGSLNKLNVSYRSDPPLQSTEIIALLAVGRTPQSTSAIAATQAVTNQSVVGTGSNTLLGQAIAAPVNSRLQRFFGVSRLRIDPQLTGLNAVPQARLTVEQQISRDITLTYITNLSQANQQIIRLEWDISRNWSVVALREENGAFGIDFFFKKRLR